MTSLLGKQEAGLKASILDARFRFRKTVAVTQLVTVYVERLGIKLKSKKLMQVRETTQPFNERRNEQRNLKTNNVFI